MTLIRRVVFRDLTISYPIFISLHLVIYISQTRENVNNNCIAIHYIDDRPYRLFSFGLRKFCHYLLYSEPVVFFNGVSA